MSFLEYDEDGVSSVFDLTHQEALAAIRRAIERKDWDAAMALFDRSFTIDGDPK